MKRASGNTGVNPRKSGARFSSRVARGWRWTSGLPAQRPRLDGDGAVGRHLTPHAGPAERATRTASVVSPTRHPSSSASTTACVPHSTSATMRTCAKRPATLTPVRAGAPELLVVGRGVGRVPAGAVHRHQPQAPPERSRRGRRGQRPGRGGKQHPQRLRAQPLPGPKQRRLGRQPPGSLPTQIAQPLGQAPQHLQVWRWREQRQGQHEIHHQPRRQQPPTLLGPATRGHHPIHQVRWIHPRQYPKPRQLWHTLSHRHHPRHRASSLCPS
jgi:hypothetical protein